MRIFIILSLGLSVFFAAHIFTSTLHAQTAPILDHCEQAKNNNAMLACVKKQHEESLDSLNALYEEVQALQSPETLNEFRSTQRDWISYRDKECAWKTHQTGNEMLKRIKQLSCLTHLTNMRVTVLTKYMDDQNTGEPEALAKIPLWMNVLGEEHPDVFWQTAKRQRGDLDCDKADEQILTGVRIYQSEPVQQEVLIAIVENPITGQPKTSVFIFPVAKQLNGTHVCTPNIEVLMDHNISSEKSEEQNTMCTSVLNIRSAGCETIKIVWDGEKYKKIANAL